MGPSGGIFYGQTFNDAGAGAVSWLEVTRSGTSVSQVVFPNGNIGIGTTGPGTLLDIQGTSGTTVGITNTGTADARVIVDGGGTGSRAWTLGTSGQDASLTTAGFFYVRDSTAGANRVTIDSSGNLGIGTTSPWRTFSVAGTVGFNSSLSQSSTGDYLCINTGTFEVSRGAGAACSTSSQRFKDNIQSISYGLAAVLNLHPVSFTYKPEMNVSTSTKLGFIAEEMRQVIPEVVNLDQQGLPSGIDYPTLTAVLAKSIQELNQKVENISQNPGGFLSLESLRDLIARLTGTIQTAGEWLFEKIATKELRVGSPEQRTGITVYDEDTGEPYCLKVKSGLTINTKGACGQQQSLPSPSPEPTATASSTPDTSVSPSPEVATSSSVTP